MDIPTDLLASFRRVTKADDNLASQLLLDSGLDLEAAISSFFAIQEAGGIPNSNDDDDQHNNITNDNDGMNIDDDDINQQIEEQQQQRQQRQNRDNDFHQQYQRQRQQQQSPPYPQPQSQRTNHIDNNNMDDPLNSSMLQSLHDTLRRQPQAPAASSASRDIPNTNNFPPTAPPVSSRHHRNQRQGSSSSSSINDPFLRNLESNERLSALFTPPTHLMNSNPFETLLQLGNSQKKWILISIYKQGEFASYEMIRDVWNNNSMQQLIESHFIFWHKEVSDANEYTSFYKIGQPPHVAIIDPRSGERVRNWSNNGEILQLNYLLNGLQDFISGNSFDSDRAIRGKNHDNSKNIQSNNDNNFQSGSNNTEENKHVPIPIDSTAEDAQLAAAIAASMEQGDDNAIDNNRKTNGSSSSGIGASSGSNILNNRNMGSSSSNGTDHRPSMNENLEDIEEADEGINDGGDRRDGQMEHIEELTQQQRQASRLLSATDPALNRSRSLRAEQDDAFEESLALDKAKAESERFEKERIEKMKHEQVRKEELEKQEELRKQEEKEKLKEEMRNRLPEEPPSTSKENVVDIAIRLPNGKRIQRRFWIHNLVGDVCDFVELQADGVLDYVQYELMSAYPKKSFADRSSNLQELAPRGALVVHLKD